MSVINQMLKDLDRRRQAAQGNGRLHVRELLGRLKEDLPVTRRQMVLLATMLCVVVGGLWFWQSHKAIAAPSVSHRRSEKPVAPLAAVSDHAAATPAPAAPTQAQPEQAPVSIADMSPQPPGINQPFTGVVAAVKPEIAATPSAPVVVAAKVENLTPVTKPVTSLAERSAETASVPMAESAEPAPRTAEPPAQMTVATPSAKPAKLRADAAQKPLVPLRISPSTPTPVNVYSQAQQQMASGDFGGAMETLRQALADAPDDARVRLALADIHVNLGQQEKARDVLREGLRRGRGEPELSTLYAKLLAEKGDGEQAIAVLNDALAIPGGNNKAELLAFAAALHQRAGDYAQAERSYRLLLQQQSDNAPWLMGLAIAMEKQGKNAEALEAFQQALYSGGLTPPVQRYISEQIRALER